VTDILKDGSTVLFDLLKKEGIPAVTDSLDKLAGEATEGWQKMLLKLGTQLVSKHGPDGLHLLEDYVSRMMAGKPVDLTGLTMREASDLLAVMQRKEADTKNQVLLWTNLIIEEIGKGLALLVSVLFKELSL